MHAKAEGNDNPQVWAFWETPIQKCTHIIMLGFFMLLLVVFCGTGVHARTGGSVSR
jgi:hypothetical protein